MISKWEMEQGAISRARARERERSMPANVNIKVSIPVTLAGYTGQREEWEERQRDCQVGKDGDKVVLTDTNSVAREMIKFDPKDLEAALRALNLTGPVLSPESQR